MLRCTCVRPSYPFAGASRSTFTPFPAYALYVCVCICIHILFLSLFQSAFTAGRLNNASQHCSSTVFVFPFFLFFFPSTLEITHLIWQFQLCLNYWGSILNNGARKLLNLIVFGFKSVLWKFFPNNSAATKVRRWKLPVLKTRTKPRR
jgi:hypothetical protein